jgi:pimeloyl-ACP methyl ester carboxylesterase
LSAFIPFNIAEAAALLADVITTHGKHGKVDLVGMSLGGYTAIYLAQKYSNLVGAGGLFLSSCGRSWPKPGSFMTCLSGLIMFLASWLLPHLPEIVLQWTVLLVSDKLLGDVRTVTTYRLGQAVAEALSEDKDSENKSWKKMSKGTHSRALCYC